MSLLDPKWKYRSAEDSRLPGYLARRFKEYAQRERERREQRANVTTLPLKRKP
jgi:hypothetical protein